MEFEILLFYKYIKIEDPEGFADKQRNLCVENDILGRIIVSHEGINGTVSGKREGTEVYRNQTLKDLGNGEMEFKTDLVEDHAFKKLSVKVRPEIVSLHLKSEEDINPNTSTGERLTPEEFLNEIENNDVIVFDGRNKYESDLGKFKGLFALQLATLESFLNGLGRTFLIPKIREF